MGDKRVIKSYVWHGDNCFLVSTADRDSSSVFGGRYAETIVWRFDWDANEKTSGMYHAEAASEGSIHGHLKTCQYLRDGGDPDELGAFQFYEDKEGKALSRLAAAGEG